MKKIYLSLVLLCFTVSHLLAVDITVKMNGVSKSMKFVEKSSEQEIATGDPEGNSYQFQAAPGTYILSAYDEAKNLNGTIEIPVTEEAEQTFSISTVTVYSTNEGWIFNQDYTLQYTAASKEGTMRVIELGETTNTSSPTETRSSFLMQVGDTYVVRFIPSAEHEEEGYLFTLASATVTASSMSVGKSCSIGQEFTVTVPKEATLFLGMKRGSTHYVPFEEITPKSSQTQDNKTVYTYMLANNTTYNYRVKQPGKLTRAGKIGVQKGVCDAIEITAEEMDYESPSYINHDPADNGMTNVADIFLNINRKGLLRLSDPAIKKDTFQIVNLRTWQITDDQSNNYYMEPDFHYTVLDENFEPSDKVIKIDEKGVIKPVGKGKAIVQVTYDAVYCWQYNKIDGFGNRNENTAFMGGALWSAIWPENTGTFIVTVGEEEDPTMKPNMEVETELQERLEDGNELDAEHDIFYYLKDQPGYYYTFKPEGVSKVEVANPDVTTNPNIATYNGFSDTNVTKNEDESYTVLLTFGRNIIRLTSATGKTTYQVVSAKPVEYSISNMSRPGDENYYPGDSIKVQFNGFFHPANKLAGIYNMSAYLYYNGVPNGTSLILGPGQYTFAGNPAAQAFPVILPNSWDEETLYLETGALQVNGYGSKPGAHRGINLAVGKNPNFTASVHVNFWGSIPNVAIPITQLTDGVKFEGIPEGIDMLVMNQRGDTIQPNKDGIYYGGPRNYTYEAFAHNRKATNGSFSITKGQGVKTIQVSMDEIAESDNGWDGKCISLPEQVTAEESAVSGGQFEGLEGYYKIKNGYELAWLSYYVNKTKDNSKTNAVLTREINLNDHEWSPIGKSSSFPYSGIFKGKGNAINGLYINSTENYQALFGYASDVEISDLTINGSVTSTGNYVSAFIGDMEGYSIISNCHNQADITGNKNVGGLVGYTYHYPRTGAPVAYIENCSNNGTIKGNQYVGGIGGHLKIYDYYVKESEFKLLINNGAITATEEYAGGIAGYLSGLNLKDVYNTGDINGQKSFGGIAGAGSSSTKGDEIPVSITNAYNTGKIVSGGSILGGSGNVTNAYTVKGEFKENDEVTVKTEEKFKSGETAWLLGESFGQTIGQENYPVLNGAKVFQVSYTSNFNNETEYVYTNKTLPVITVEGYSGNWYDKKGGEIISEISRDSELYVLFIDDIAPTKPEGLEAEPDENSITVSWLASTDNIDVKEYNVYVNGILNKTVTETSATIAELAEDTEYTIEVSAVDAAGNESGKAAITLVTLKKDTSIDSWEADGIEVYPNPFKSQVNIRVPESQSISIYNASGQCILQKDIQSGINPVNTSDLSSGVYIIKCNSGIIRVIKE